MKLINKFFLILTLFCATGISEGCSDNYFDGPDSPEGPSISLDFSFSDGTRANENTVSGEPSNHENDINTADLFFYDNTADDETAAKLVKHFTNVGNATTVNVSIGDLKNAFGETANQCKVIAVLNCTKTKDLTVETTISILKSIEIKADEKDNADNTDRAFKSANAPHDFVMTNLDNPVKVTWTETEGGNGTIKLKRVAAKMRVALNVDSEITDNEGEKWYPDLSNMRLYISNGVTRGQLDGTHIDLNSADFYSIITTGSQDTEESDYLLAHRITSHSSQTEKAPTDEENYLYYNDVPYYSYPNSWSESMLETTQTTLTIVVPWEQKEGNKRVSYKPSYYIIPVNKGTTIESNKYYYLRLHIGMMGSVTPEKPMEVDMECEIADWGQAKDTKVDIRPIRYLIFNQTEFEMNNTTEIEIPFISTHDCEVVKFEGQFSNFYLNQYGEETSMEFNDETNYYINGSDNGNSSTSDGKVKGEGKLYNYSVDNNQYILKFNHNFFKYWKVSSSSTNRKTDDGSDIYTVTGFISPTNYKESSQYHRLFSKFVAKITVRHSTNDPQTDMAYEETVTLEIYPAIYLSSEKIPDGDDWESRGWLYVNGYSRTNTGSLGNAGVTARADRKVSCLTTLTITKFNTEESQKWSLDDPRSYFINNDLSGTDNLEDKEDLTDINGNLVRWSDLFNGTQTNRNSRTINGKSYSGSLSFWKYKSNVDNVIWSKGTWEAKKDQETRTMTYYYPCAESLDKINIIAPKIIINSYHMYSDRITRPAARRRCATLQQYGYPAGRWRLPTLSEIGIFKDLQEYEVIRDIFYASKNNSTSGGIGTNWSNIGPTGNGVNYGGTSSYVRCVYDLWYWDKVDKNNQSTARIPEVSDYYYFTWGDRPKENPLTRSGGDSYTVQEYLQENGPGNYAITRDGDEVVKRERMK